MCTLERRVEIPARSPDATLEEDLEYMIDRVESAPSFDFPFKSYTYFCDIWRGWRCTLDPLLTRGS